jgi:hypothetical protein
MKPTYSIRHWDEEFENHESRKLRRVRWVSVPNKHDGKTFNRIAQHPKAIDIFCGWSLIVQVASKMPTRGVLFDKDGPLDAQDLADQTRFPVQVFEAALEVLSELRYGWLEKTDGPPKPIEAPAPIITPPLLRPTSRNHQPKLIDESELPFDSAEFKAEWADYLILRTQLRKKLTPISQKRLFKQFLEWGEARTIAALKWSIPKGWQGVFEPHLPGAAVAQKPMFQAATETPEEKVKRENCKRCRGTETELVPGKGARPCDHEIIEDEEE